MKSKMTNRSGRAIGIGIAFSCLREGERCVCAENGMQAVTARWRFLHGAQFCTRRGRGRSHHILWMAGRVPQREKYFANKAGCVNKFRGNPLSIPGNCENKVVGFEQAKIESMKSENHGCQGLRSRSTCEVTSCSGPEMLLNCHVLERISALSS
jgi:hypothetical protein